MREKFSTYNLKEGSEINNSIANLPVAIEKPVFVDNTEQKEFKAILVNGEVVDIPTRHYHTMQHKDAFKPVIEGMTQAGMDRFKFSLYHTKTRAYLNLFMGQINDGKSHIQIGVSIVNSFDRTRAVDCGFTIDMRQAFIEIVGYRQICSNGMKIRVPLDQAEFVKPELRVKIQSLLSESMSYKHTSTLPENVIKMQYMAEAFAMLQKPLEIYIEKAKAVKMDDMEKVKKLISFHFSERMQQKILARYKQDLEVEGNSVWSLYNAVTFVGSHDTTVSQKESTELKASLIMEEALKPTITV